jgi:hypothetical protein
MPRAKNPVPTVQLRVRTSKAVVDGLGALVATGYFGKSPADAAEEILRLRVFELLKNLPGPASRP